MNYRAGRGMGTAARGMALRRGHERRRRRQGQRVRVQPRRAPGDRVRPRGQVPALVGRGGVPARRTASRIGPDGTLWLTDDLHHTIRQFTPEGKLLLTIGDPDQAVDAARRQAVQPPDARGALPADRRRLHLGRLRQLARAQVRSRRAGTSGRGASPGTDPGCFNLPHNIATDADGPRLRGRPREPPRADLRRRRAATSASGTTCTGPCGLFADRRQGDAFYVGELPSAPGRQRGGAQHRRARQRRSRIKGELLGRVGGRFAGEKPGEFVAPHGCAVDSRGDLYVAEVSLDGAGQHGNAAARDPLAAEIRARRVSRR